jgi:hypothetical protein
MFNLDWLSQGGFDLVTRFGWLNESDRIVRLWLGIWNTAALAGSNVKSHVSDAEVFGPNSLAWLNEHFSRSWITS